MGAQPEVRDALFRASDSRENFKQIIAKRSDLVQYKSGRLAPSMAAGLYRAGLVLGYAATGADAGFYKAYAVGNTDGSQTAVGVLSEDAMLDAGSGAKDGSQIAIIREGQLLQDLLIGLDAGAITNMGGKAYVEDGVNILAIRA